MKRLLLEKPLWALNLVLLALFHEPLTGSTFYFRDVSFVFLPKKIFLATALRDGAMPLWDPLTHGGQPFLANPVNAALYPTNLLLYLFSPVTAFNLIVVLQYFLAGWAAYALARVLQLSPLAAMVSGAAFSLCGFVLSLANMPAHMLALPWIAVTWLLVELLLRDRRRIWFAAACLAAAMPLVAGAAEVTGVLLVTVTLWVVFARRDLLDRRMVAALILVALFSVTLPLFQVVPALDLIEASFRAQSVHFEEFVKWSMNIRRAPELIVPRFFGRHETFDDYWGAALESGFPWAVSIYFGPALVILMSGGLMSREPLAGRERRVLGALALAGVLITLGRALPLIQFVHENVPVLSKLRYPIKGFMFAVLPIAILAGSGVDALRRRTDRGLLAVAAALSGALVLLLAIAPLMFSPALDATEARELRTNVASALLVAVLTLALLYVHRRGRDISVLLATVVVADLAIAGYGVNLYAPRDVFAEPPLAQATRSIIGEGRLYHGAPQPDVPLPSPTNHRLWQTWWDVRLLRQTTPTLFSIPLIFHIDHEGLAPVRVAFLTSQLRRMPMAARLPLLQAAGVTAVITRDRLPPPATLVTAVPDVDKQPLYLYRLDSPRVRFATRVRSAASEEEALGRVLGRFETEGVVVVAPNPGIAPCSGATLATVSRSGTAEIIDVNAPCPGYLVFSEVFFPGWEYEIDGRPAQVLPADFAFSAVAVGEGRHVVRRFYRPRRVASGVVSSVVALLLLPLAAWRLKLSA